MEKQLKTVVMPFKFDLATHSYHVGFLEADGMTPLPWTGRYKTKEPPYRIVQASHQGMSSEAQLERHLSTTRRGMVRLRLMPVQYEHLKSNKHKSSTWCGDSRYDTL